MKWINLANRKGLVQVDDEDYEYLSQWSWTLSTKGYAQRCQGGKTFFMHRVINKTPDGLKTDHINGDKLDNRKTNLRNATTKQNGMNRISTPNTSSQYKGVSWCKKKRKWLAQLWSDNKLIHLGYFASENDAAKAYNRVASELHGEFARLNEVSV